MATSASTISGSPSKDNSCTVLEVLIHSLYDLKQDDFELFRYVLSNFRYEDKQPIGYGCLEVANRDKTAKLLMDFYGETSGLEVTYQVFIKINLRGPAEKLQEEQRRIRSPSSVEEEDDYTDLDVLIRSMLGLNQENFELFQYKLSDFCYENKNPIGYGCLEYANRVQTAKLLVDFYGESHVLEVTYKVFMKINLRGPAEKLQVEQKRISKRHALNRNLEDCKMKYTEHVKRKYQLFEDRNALLGQADYLNKRYTRLLLIRKHRNEEEREHEITSSGHWHLRLMANLESAEYSATSIEALFNTEDEVTPKAVVLMGPAGIGKTMTTQKIMLDWASGNLYQGLFNYVFYISYREINTISCKISIASLISKMCQLKCSHSQIKSILHVSEKILFIIDGFDELNLSISSDTGVCDDPFRESTTGVLLKSLLGNHVLDEASLIVTTRPYSLAQLKECIRFPRYVEVLGFTEKDREEYFYNFFKKKDDASQAVSVVKENETLYTMCAVPITCWIVCTVMKQQLEKGLRLILSKTTTSIYMLYLKNALTRHGAKSKPSQTTLVRKLSSVAMEGVWDQKVLFTEDDLEKHGITVKDVESAFLNENVFQREIETYTSYSFIHLSIQEFFAALYYALKVEPTDRPEIQENQRDFTYLLKCRRPHLGLVIQFLFGLSGLEQRREIERNFGYNLTSRITSALEGHLKEEASIDVVERLLARCNSYGLNESLHCLYETQDTDFVKRMMPHFSSLDVQENINFRALSFCLEESTHQHTLKFHGVTMGPKEQEILSSGLHKCFHICFNFCSFSVSSSDIDEYKLRWLCSPRSRITYLGFDTCDLTPLCGQDISSFILLNQRLQTLHLSNNNLGDQGVNFLCEGLRHPHCTLKHLFLNRCSLTSASCDVLLSVICTNRSLIKMELKENRLQDVGVRRLCKGLKSPECSLQHLSLYKCGLTAACGEDLQSVIIENRSLIQLVLSEDELQETGVNLLCDGLRHPECTLQEIRLFKCRKSQWSESNTMTIDEHRSLNRETLHLNPGIENYGGW